MPGLSRELVEHRLPIKDGFRPYKQPVRRFNPYIYDRVKEKMNRLFEANFIRPCWYANWISNIVLVEKKGTGKIRICIDFHNLNRATPKGEYHMPIADMLVNDLYGHKVISFLDGNVGYNQIFMAEEDMHEMAFRCPTFGLKMNPLKCAFGVSADKFLGFIIHENGIEIDPKNIEAIQKIQAPTCKKGVQKFICKVNFLQQFITNLSSKLISFTPILRLKDEAKFTWGAKQEVAFHEIKHYLSTPPVLRAPKSGESFRLYIAAQEDVIGVVLMQ
jgi:hypothetical protein